jgi:exopolyphosphatase/guanosine-5'-triphosphate,3'-diphosphate pyrophosphatase
MPSSAPSAAPSRRAIIDIGSNTVRMVIYDGPPRAPHVFYNEKITARLGKNVAEDGVLSVKASTTALAALARYALILRLHGVEDVGCVATAAVRDAANGGEFLARVAELGLSPRLLSGEEEALASADGVRAAFPGAQGIVGDLGGGSLELVAIGDFGSRHGVSLPLGTLRLPALRAAGPERFARRIHRLLRASDWSEPAGQPFYLVGGSWRALARVAMIRDHWPVDDPHGYELAPGRAAALARTLAALSRPPKPALAKAALAKISAKPIIGKRPPADLTSLAPPGSGISASRVASLPDAAALLAVLVREIRPSRLVFSGWGLREGLLARGLSPAAAASDPLVAGVEGFVAGLGREIPQTSRQVAQWCAGAVSPGDNSRASLRLCATMLAFASLRTEPNLRAEQAAEWALRKRWIGIDAEGRAMLAVAVRANSGHIEIPEPLARMATPARLREGLAWGLAVRLCRRLSVGAAEALAETALTIDGGRLVLSARGPMQALYNETVAKDHRLLADCLGLQPAFVGVSDAVLPARAL